MEAARSLRIQAVKRSGLKTAPKPLNLGLPVKARKPHHQQTDYFDARPFSFIDNDPVTPGFDPVTPFEITPPTSPGDSASSDDEIIDSPGPTAGFYNKMRDAVPDYDNVDNEGKHVASAIGFTQDDHTYTSKLRNNLMQNKKLNIPARNLSVEDPDEGTTPIDESDVEPCTPFEIDHEMDFPAHATKATPKRRSKPGNILKAGFTPSKMMERFATTELVMPMPQHPTPLSPTMERFLSKMSSDIAPTPASARFPTNVHEPQTSEDEEEQSLATTSHVIDINHVSVIAMEFGPQNMIDITANVALVQQEADPITDHKSPPYLQQHTYMIPIVLNDPESFCACSALVTDDDSSSIVSASDGILHPNNLLRLEDVIVQVRLAPRPRIKRHGWSFLNIGIPVRTALGIMDSLEKDMISIGRCKMVLHGDHYWMYTPVRAFTKIYRRAAKVKQSRRATKSPSSMLALSNGHDDNEGAENLYTPMSENSFFQQLETRSLKVDLYAETYAKSQTPLPILSPAEGDFTLGVSIREIVVIGESNLRGPEWATTKAQRTKCLARGHVGGDESVSALSPTGSNGSERDSPAPRSSSAVSNNVATPTSWTNSASATPTSWNTLNRNIRTPQTVVGSPVSSVGTPVQGQYQSLNSIRQITSKMYPDPGSPAPGEYRRLNDSSVLSDVTVIDTRERRPSIDDTSDSSWQAGGHERKVSEESVASATDGAGKKPKKKWKKKFF